MMKKVDGLVKKMNKYTCIRLLCVTMMIIAPPMPVYAATGYTAPLTALKTILTTIATAAGAILLIYGAIRFAISFQKMDQNGEHSAIFTIVAGGVLIGISAILAALGV